MSTKKITLQRLEREVIEVPITGITPLIPHKWSEKALRSMPGHHEGGLKTQTKGEAYNPEEEAERCLYRFRDGQLGFPATAFKAAMVSACRKYPQITMAAAKTLFFVEGEGPDQLVAIKAKDSDLTWRMDTVRDSRGGTQLRYRYMIWPWGAVLRIRFEPASIAESSIIHLVDAAGTGGIGDWRPSSPKSSSGTYGQFEIEVPVEEGK